MKRLNVGIVGLGVVSKVHIPICKDTNNLVAICDIDTKKTEKFEDNNIKKYSNFMDMLNNEKLDVVHILTPHNLRYEIIKACCEKSINILIEKPTAHTYEEGIKIKELIKNYPNLKIGVVFQNRRNNSYELLLEKLNKKEMGKIIGIEGTCLWCRDEAYYEAAPWRGKLKQSGGGLLINQAIHVLDWMQNIGGKIKKIEGKTFNLKHKNIEVEDSSSIRIEFENSVFGFFTGTVAGIDNSNVTLKVKCENGAYLIRDNKLFQIIKNDEKFIVSDEKGTAKHYYGASHKKEILCFYDCIINNTFDFVNVEDSLKSLYLISEVYKKNEQEEK
ncbi:MAG: Gfo/Idh/MocA family protein [Fusobacteriaceae bacterium]